MAAAHSGGPAGSGWNCRFFVTRLGFLRSSKRVLALSDTKFAVLEPGTGEIKDSCPYSQVQELAINPDMPDQGFSITIGGKKESYSSRTRDAFFVAFHKFREIAQEGPGRGTVFPATKQSTTRGPAETPVQIEVLLAIRATSFDRLDARSRETVSSISLVEIVKVQKLEQDATSFIVYFENNRVHRYWSSQRDSLLNAIGNNMREHLNVSLRLEAVESAFEFDALRHTRDIPIPVMFEMPVWKISKTTQEPMTRLLAVAGSSILERDPTTRRTLAQHSIGDVFNLVRCPHDDSTLILQLKTGRNKTFRTRACAVRTRTSSVAVGLNTLSAEDEAALREAATLDVDPEAQLEIPGSEVVGGMTVLSAVAARDVLMCNVIEHLAMNKVHCPWSLAPITTTLKLEAIASTLHPEYEELLLRRLQGATAETAGALAREFNANIPIAGFKHRERRAVLQLLRLLEPGVRIADADLVAVMLALQRLFYCKVGFDEVPKSEARRAIQGTFAHLLSDNSGVAYAAAGTIRAMLMQLGDVRGTRQDAANRKAVFIDDHASLLIRSMVGEPGSEMSSPTALAEGERALVVSVVLDTVSNLTHQLSAKKKTGDRVFRELLEGMSMVDGRVRRQLFLLTRSPCLAIVKSASQQLKVHLLEQSPQVSRLLQDHALADGVLLWQLFLALDSPSRAQRKVSKVLVALLAHENTHASDVIRGCFPPPLLGVPSSQLTYNEWGDPIHRYPQPSGGMGDARPQCVLLLPDFFERVTDVTRTPELLWGPEAVKELCASLLRELARYDHARERAARRGQTLCWNAHEFEVAYSCYRFEAKVSRYYLRYMLTSTGALRTDVDVTDADDLLAALYYRVANDSHAPTRLLCLHTMAVLYSRYRDSVRSLPFLSHMVVLASAEGLPLTVQAAFLRLFCVVFASPSNVRRFLDAKGVRLVVRIAAAARKQVSSSPAPAPAPVRAAETIPALPPRDAVPRTPVIEDADDDEGEEKKGEKEEETGEPEERELLDLVASESTTAADVVLECLDLLVHLVQQHPSVNRGGSSLWPLPRVVAALGEPAVLFDLVALIPTGHPEVIKQTVYFLQRFLDSADASITSSIYRTGIFYYLLRYASVDPTKIGRLLGDLHLRQGMGALGRSRTEVVLQLEAAQVEGSLQALDADEITIARSVLTPLLPPSLVLALQRDFAEVWLQSDETPDLVWNSQMREQLCRHLDRILERHTTSAGGFQWPTDGSVPEPMRYPSLDNRQVVYSFYLDNLVDEEKFPGWPIPAPAPLLRALTAALQASPSPLLLRAMALVLRRFPFAVDFQAYDGMGALAEAPLLVDPMSEVLAALALNVENVRGQEALALSLAGKVLAATRTRPLGDPAIVRCLAALVPLLSSAASSSGSQGEQEGQEGQEDELMIDVLRSLDASALAPAAVPVHAEGEEEESREVAKEAAAALSAACAEDPVFLATRCVEAVASSGLRLPSLMQQLQEGGAIWRLMRSLFSSQDVSDARMPVARERAEAAVVALRAMAGPADGSARASDALLPAQHRMRAGLCVLLPADLLDALRAPDAGHFLSEVTSAHETPRLIWNNAALDELKALVDDKLSSASGADVPETFRYRAHQVELVVGGVFLRVYNLMSEHWHPKAPSTFLASLITSISEDLAGVQSTGAAAAISDRLDVELQAAFNLCTYCPEVLAEASRLAHSFVLLAGISSNTLLPASVRLGALRVIHLLIGHSPNADEFGHNCLSHLFGMLEVAAQGSGAEMAMSAAEVDDLAEAALHFIHLLIARCSPAAEVVPQLLGSGTILTILLVLAGGRSQSPAPPGPNARSRAAAAICAMRVDQAQGPVVAAALDKLLPPALLQALAADPATAVDLLDGTHESPVLLWGESARVTLRGALSREMQELRGSKRANPSAQWAPSEGQPLVYAASEVQAGGVYLRLFNAQPGYPLSVERRATLVRHAFAQLTSRQRQGLMDSGNETLMRGVLNALATSPGLSADQGGVASAAAANADLLFSFIDGLTQPIESPTHALGAAALDVLGTLAQVPSVGDGLITAADAGALGQLVPALRRAETAQLLLCSVVLLELPSTAATATFTRNAVELQLVARLLDVLGGEYGKETKVHAARLLLALSRNPTNGSSVSVNSVDLSSVSISVRQVTADLRELLPPISAVDVGAASPGADMDAAARRRVLQGIAKKAPESLSRRSTPNTAQASAAAAVAAASSLPATRRRASSVGSGAPPPPAVGASTAAAAPTVAAAGGEFSAEQQAAMQRLGFAPQKVTPNSTPKTTARRSSAVTLSLTNRPGTVPDRPAPPVPSGNLLAQIAERGSGSSGLRAIEKPDDSPVTTPAKAARRRSSLGLPGNEMLDALASAMATRRVNVEHEGAKEGDSDSESDFDDDT